MTWHTGEHVNVRVVVCLRCLALSHSFLAHIAWLKMFECLSHPIHAWSERFIWLPWSLHHLHLPSLIPHQPQAVPATLQLLRGFLVRSLCCFVKEMGSTDESFSNTSYEPKDYFLTETYVESLTEPMTKQRFPEQRFLEDVDYYDDAAIGEMLFNAHREQVHRSQREGLSVGQSSSSVSDKSGQPVVERGQEQNTEHAQIRNQGDYDRRSIQKLSATIESQQQELHDAQAEEVQRRDQQLPQGQLLKQNWGEAHEKSLTEMKELKKVSEFHLRHYCKTNISRGSGHYSGTYW